MVRLKLLFLWALCVAMSPILLFAMFVQMVIGSEDRAKSIALAYDVCGNDALGGTPGLSISAQVGNALKRGRAWAKPSAWIIDRLMGEGHCLDNATIK